MALGDVTKNQLKRMADTVQHDKDILRLTIRDDPIDDTRYVVSITIYWWRYENHRVGSWDVLWAGENERLAIEQAKTYARYLCDTLGVVREQVKVQRVHPDEGA